MALDLAKGSTTTKGKESPARKVAVPKDVPAVDRLAPSKAPPKVAAKVQEPAVSATGKWRIQLGAFGQRKSGELLFSKIGSKLPGAQAYYVPAGAVVRLQAGPFPSRNAAAAACTKLSPQPCFPVEVR
jgi:cell division septation protein DedD